LTGSVAGCLGLSRTLLAATILAGLAGCALAPPYHPPQYALPSAWRGQPAFASANPRDTLPRGPWWEAFGDKTLDRLEQQLGEQNPSLAAMYEQYVQARDAVAVARSALYPQISTSALASYNRRSDNALFKNPAINTFNTQPNTLIEAGLTWQPDFWGRLKNGERQEARLAQSSAALFANARLSLQTQLATTYIALRGLDAQDVIFRNAVAYYEQSVEITGMRLKGAIGSGLDAERAQAQLASTQAQQVANVGARGVLEHAIAVLVGANPSTFAIPPTAEGGPVVPAVPAGVPSQLLERRPDIASAERQMAAANAGIGIARAAFYPDITLSATGGFQDTGVNLASLPNSLWSLGAAVVLPLFEGGLRRAELQRSWSQFAQTQDLYRATVLTAFQQVEDGLTLSGSLQSQTQAQQRAVDSANQAVTMTQQLYIGGTTTYLDVVVAQQTALLDALAAQQARTLQLQTTVSLIGALGGGWDRQDLPTESGVLPFAAVDLLNHDRYPRPDGTGERGPSLPPSP
jgi:NodT family efflux transporter outer membrane factor (OMF) lipoprotein